MNRLTYPIRGNKMDVSLSVTREIYAGQSQFQTIQILETEVFGKVLLLDGHIQLTTFDEAAYHECLVQIPLLNLSQPQSALIIGGGDGGAVRELCRSTSLESIEMVEIDQAVIEASKQHLPELSQGCFDDPRLKLHIADAFGFVKSQSAAYDLIIADSTDTYEGEDGNLSEALFTQEFYRDCLNALKPGGLVVTQADNPVICPYSLDEIEERFRSVFPKVGSYFGLVPSFGGYSAFCWGGHLPNLCPEMPASDLKFRYLNEGTYRLAVNPPRFS